MVLGTWHEFEFEWSGENAQGGPKIANLYVDGELACTVSDIQIDNDEEMEPKITHYQNSGGAASYELDIDYYDLLIQGRG